MTRKEFNTMFEKPPLLESNHGTVCVCGYDLNVGTLRSVLALYLENLGTAMSRAASAMAPRVR